MAVVLLTSLAHRQFVSYVCMAITYSKSKDQPGKVANPARGQLKGENEYFPVPLGGLRMWCFRDGFGSPVPSPYSG